MHVVRPDQPSRACPDIFFSLLESRSSVPDEQKGGGGVVRDTVGGEQVVNGSLLAACAPPVPSTPAVEYLEVGVVALVSHVRLSVSHRRRRVGVCSTVEYMAWHGMD